MYGVQSCPLVSSVVYLLLHSFRVWFRMNTTGTMIATSSEVGTVIKVLEPHSKRVKETLKYTRNECIHEVFASIDCLQLFEFRRGTSPSVITSISFRKDNLYLVVSSYSPLVWSVIYIFPTRSECSFMLRVRVQQCICLNWSKTRSKRRKFPVNCPTHYSRFEFILRLRFELLTRIF
jgi:hypothetical protein